MRIFTRQIRCLVALCLAAATACALGALPAAAQGASLPAVLSNETTFTRWANADAAATVRQHPGAHSRRVARLRYFTEDGYPEVYLALRSFRDKRGHEWVRIRVPMRPNGRTGWVLRGYLGPLHYTSNLLVVGRHRMTATLYRKGRRIFRAPVGTGKPSTPTPPGHFWIRERLHLPSSTGLYGPLAFGTSDYSVLSDWPGGGVVGIHGTNQPYLVPGHPSHGCIRMHNRDILRLGRLMTVGTPLRVL